MKLGIHCQLSRLFLISPLLAAPATSFCLSSPSACGLLLRAPLRSHPSLTIIIFHTRYMLILTAITTLYSPPLALSTIGISTTTPLTSSLILHVPDYTSYLPPPSHLTNRLLPNLLINLGPNSIILLCGNIFSHFSIGGIST